MTHFFFILFGMRKMASFELWISSVLRQDQDIWIFYSSLTLNNGKLICYFRSPYYAIVLNMTHLFIQFGMREKKTCFEISILPVLIFYFSSEF